MKDRMFAVTRLWGSLFFGGIITGFLFMFLGILGIDEGAVALFYGPVFLVVSIVIYRSAKAKYDAKNK